VVLEGISSPRGSPDLVAVREGRYLLTAPVDALARGLGDAAGSAVLVDVEVDSAGTTNLVAYAVHADRVHSLLTLLRSEVWALQ
jgi:hypothetical protein